MISGHKSTNDDDDDDDVFISSLSIVTLQVLFDLMLLLRCMLIMLIVLLLLQADGDSRTNIDAKMKGIATTTCSRRILMNSLTYWMLSYVT